MSGNGTSIDGLAIPAGCGRGEHRPGLDAPQAEAGQAGGGDGLELPVIRGSRWFDAAGGAFVLRVECPLSFDEMVAAVYGQVEEAEIEDDEDLCGCVVVSVLLGGLPALKERVRRIRHDEMAGAIASPEFLALCRRRVAALLSETPA
jgi:hypothetical protein